MLMSDALHWMNITSYIQCKTWPQGHKTWDDLTFSLSLIFGKEYMC